MNSRKCPKFDRNSKPCYRGLRHWQDFLPDSFCGQLRMSPAQRHKNAYGEHHSQLPIVETHRPRADAPRREMVGRREAQDEQRLRRAQVA